MNRTTALIAAALSGLSLLGCATGTLGSDSEAGTGDDGATFGDSGQPPLLDSGGAPPVTPPGSGGPGGGSPDSGGPPPSIGSSATDAMPPVDDAGAADAGSGASAVPTTCSDAYDKIGCCVGNELYYCSKTTITKKGCTGGQVCGWDSAKSYYGCVASPGGADPSGANPIDCK